MSTTPAQPEPTAPTETPPEAVGTEPAAPQAVAAEPAEAQPADGQTGDLQREGATDPVAEPRVVIPADGPLTDAQIAAIAATAQPAIIRRAPRYRVFFWTGALVGIVLGVVLGTWLSFDGMVNRWIYVTVTVLGTTLVTVLCAGGLAVLTDKRSAKVAKRRRNHT